MKILPDLVLDRLRNVQICHTSHEVIGCLKAIYENNTKKIQDIFALSAESQSEENVVEKVKAATYPFIGMHVTRDHLNGDGGHFSYGFITEEGFYGATLTQPDIFEDYYREQIQSLMERHKTVVYVGESDQPIPLPFALALDQALTPDSQTLADPEHLWFVQQNFILPNLSSIDDDISNSVSERGTDVRPLSLFSAERVDLSLHRLHHYTCTSIKHFQRFILLTNYQRYVDAFVTYGRSMLSQSDEYEALVEPGDVITRRHGNSLVLETTGERGHLPQMPAYHLTRADGNGITFINIGVGPSNAKTITDHLAVLRPHCWLMLGHCAGLRRSQLLGDYVLAHAYVRADHVLDDDLPAWIPIPPIAEVQVALQKAVAKVTGQWGHELKSRMRTGTVFTTDNRNWEFKTRDLWVQFQQSRAMAVDMESATVAANGFRFRVPYGTLLCVSDKPIHGEVKLQGMANAFYRQRVVQHLEIGLAAMRILREEGPENLHSRKLRGFDDPPFR